ncbi:MAG: M43 family zinc metalloprotease [Planctomycetota bacterium]
MSTPRISRVSFCLSVAALCLLPESVRSFEPDELIVQVSVKRVLSSSGQLPGGRWGSSTEISRTIDRCNAALRRSDSHVVLDLVEVVNAQGAGDFFNMSASDMANFESRAKVTPGFAWNSDAANIYVVNTISDAGGICSFPTFGPHRDLMVINSGNGILGGSEGWLHELGHYFNLIHTHEGDRVADTVEDTPIPNPFNCGAHDSNFENVSEGRGDDPTDTYNLVRNVMSYHCDPQVLTPLQLVRMERALFDYRSFTIPPLEEILRPSMEIATDPEGDDGIFAWTGEPLTIRLDSSGSLDPNGDRGETMTRRWEILEGDGASFVSSTRGWDYGRSGFGYGDNDDLTLLSDMEGRYVSLYLTRTFDLPDPDTLASLVLDVTYDDGFVAYLNGEAIAQRNVPSNPGPNTTALSAGEPTRELIDLSSALQFAREGRNRLSIQAHNAEIDSSDLTIHPVLSARRSSGTRVGLIDSRDGWYYWKGRNGAPPADWTEPDFDPGAIAVDVQIGEPGIYRIRVTGDTGYDDAREGSTEIELTVGTGFFLRGDCNTDGQVDLSDAIAVLLDLFAGGPPNPCPDACDANDDEVRDLSDAVRILDFLFRDGPSFPAPFPRVGIDLEGDELGCAE